MLKPKQSFIKSFKNAFLGLSYVAYERNLFIQLIIGILTLFLTFILDISHIERIIIILLIAIVLFAETFNTAIEILLDHIAPEPNHYIARVKDILAAAVFIICLAALIIGILIFTRVLAPSISYA